MTATGNEPITLDNLKAFKKEFVDGASGGSGGDNTIHQITGVNGIFYRTGNIVFYVIKNSVNIVGDITAIETSIPDGYKPKVISGIGSTKYPIMLSKWNSATEVNDYLVTEIAVLSSSKRINLFCYDSNFKGGLASSSLPGKILTWITDDEMPIS